MFNAGRFSQEYLINKTLKLVAICFALLPFVKMSLPWLFLAIRLSTKACHVIILLSRTFSTRPGGGEGAKQSFIRRRLRPGVQPLTLLYTIFDRKRNPFRMSSIDQWDTFHIPSLELCIPFNCCKWAVFKIRINHDTRTFS